MIPERRKNAPQGASGLATLALLPILLAVGHPVAMATPPTPGQQADTARRSLQHAVHLEEAVGDPEAAIAAYEDVIAWPGTDAPVAAVAHFRLAMLLERIGRGSEARQHHREIAVRYGNDPRLAELVALARAALGDRSRTGNESRMVARRLWAGSEAYAYGSLAPDGSYLSFVDRVSGNLAVHDLDRESRRYLTHMDRAQAPERWACSTAVSPDGQRIAYTLYEESEGHQIRLVFADGNGDRLLTAPGEAPRHVELQGWSRDGRSLLALMFEPDSTSRLALVSVDDGSVDVIRGLSGPAPDTVSLSPDGRWIAYHQEIDGGHDIFVTPTSGGEPTALVAHAANDLLPLWAPDGRHLLFVSDRTGSPAAWAIGVEQGNAQGTARLIKPDFGRSLPMGFTDQGALIYAVQASMNDIYIAAFDPVTGAVGEREVASGRYVGLNRSPTWSGDGKKVVYLSERGPLPAGIAPVSVVFRDRRTGEERTLATDLRRPMVPRWEPTTESVWIEAVTPEGGWGIYRVPFAGGEPELVDSWAEDLCACGFPPAAAAGKVAYLRPASAAAADLVALDVATGASAILLPDLDKSDLGGLSFSPDGKALAAAIRAPEGEPAGWHLVSIPATGGPPRTLASLGADPEAIALLGWLPDTNALIATRREGHQRLLLRVDVESGAVRLLPEAVPDDVRDLELHPDGRHLVFTAGENRTEIWMLENPLVAAGEPD